ncbi:MAG: dienelactone hydrolase family protein [Planctomycetota bacterium]
MRRAQRALILATLLGLAPIATAHSQREAVRSATGMASAPTFQWENTTAVEIKTKDSLKLRASYFEPKKKTQLAPGAILVHDTGSSRAELMDVGERLHKTGFAVLVLDLRGHGESAQDETDWAKLDDDGRKRLWALAVRDLEAASGWLRDRKEVHSTNLNLVGFRAGAALAARHSLRDENVRSVALIEPRSEELGIDVAGDLQELGGLPTYIVSKKAEKKATEAMIQEAHQASGGHPFIELMVCSAKKKADETPKVERKTCVSIAKWMKEKAFPPT